MIGIVDALLWIGLAACVVVPLVAVKHRGVAAGMSLVALAALAATIAAPLLLARIAGP